MPQEQASASVRQKIANNITRFFNESDLTMTEFANKMNVDRSTASRYKSGKVKPSHERLILMAEIFNKHVHEFYE